MRVRGVELGLHSTSKAQISTTPQKAAKYSEML
jgi:hypothetical protein